MDAGAQDALQYGILAGYPVLGVKLTLVDGAYHEVDSSEMAFKIAGSIAMKEAARMAKPGAARADDEPSRSSPPRTTWVTSSAT